MTDHIEAKTAAQLAIDRADDDLRALSLSIHEHPELGFQEHHAHGLLTAYLEQRGFEVTCSAYDLPTSFRAVAGSGEPVVALLCEYDALQEMGHACGHNLIAITGVAAGMAVRNAIGERDGKVVVLGTPAEEGGGGKIILLERGAFAGVSAVLIAHPERRESTCGVTTGRHGCTVDYFGRSAQAAAHPQEGINALDALVVAYSAIAVLRQQLTPDARIHGIITKGGVSPNTIPDHTSAQFMVRATDKIRLDELRERVHACFQAAAMATGCRVEVRWEERPYWPIAPNQPIARAFHENAQLLGWSLPSPDQPVLLGASTDVGNVSHSVPTISPTYAIPSEASNHGPGFAVAAATPEAHAAAMRAAKVLAMTALDVVLRPALLEAAQEEFRARHPSL